MARKAPTKKATPAKTPKKDAAKKQTEGRTSSFMKALKSKYSSKLYKAKTPDKFMPLIRELHNDVVKEQKAILEESGKGYVPSSFTADQYGSFFVMPRVLNSSKVPLWLEKFAVRLSPCFGCSLLIREGARSQKVLFFGSPLDRYSIALAVSVIAGTLQSLVTTPAVVKEMKSMFDGKWNTRAKEFMENIYLSLLLGELPASEFKLSDYDDVKVVKKKSKLAKAEGDRIMALAKEDADDDD